MQREALKKAMADQLWKLRARLDICITEMDFLQNTLARDHLLQAEDSIRNAQELMEQED